MLRCQGLPLREQGIRREGRNWANTRRANCGGGIVLVEMGKQAGAVLKKFPESVLQDRFRRLVCASLGARKSVPPSSVMFRSRGNSRACGDRGSLVGAAAVASTMVWTLSDGRKRQASGGLVQSRWAAAWWHRCAVITSTAGAGRAVSKGGRRNVLRGDPIEQEVR